MRRAENFYVEAVSVVPPIIEWRGGDHRGGAPRNDERAERAAASPHGDAGIAQRMILVKSNREN